MLWLPGHLFFNTTKATCFGETGRNLNKWLTQQKRVSRNGDLNNNIAERHLQTNHRINWDSAGCVIYSTDCYQRLTLESWFTNIEQTPLNQCQQLPAPYKRLINATNQTIDWTDNLSNSGVTRTIDGSKRTNQLLRLLLPITWQFNWPIRSITRDINTIHWRYNITSNDSEDDYRSGCRNVSHCHQQFFSELPSNPDDHTR